MKHGAEINFSDPKYGSAMHLALELENVHIVRILLKNGCNTKGAIAFFGGKTISFRWEYGLYIVAMELNFLWYIVHIWT